MRWFKPQARPTRPPGIWLSRQVLWWHGHRLPDHIHPDYQCPGDPPLVDVQLLGFATPDAAEDARVHLGSLAAACPFAAWASLGVDSLSLLGLAHQALRWNLPMPAHFELCEALLQIRDQVRRRQPSPLIGGLPLLCVDKLMRASPREFYLRGWFRDCHGPLTRLNAISPEGLVVSLIDRIRFTPRRDIRPLFPGDTYTGFLAGFTLPCLSLLSGGWLVEIETAGGFSGEAPTPALCTDPAQALQSALADLTLEIPPRLDGVAGRVDSFVQQVLTERRRTAHIVHDRSWGCPPKPPSVSVLVPLYQRIDLMEHQVVQFARDPAWRDAELIYLLDSPEATPSVLSLADDLASLYRLPLRVITFNASLGFAAINNEGARLARGDLLLFLNSDVLPVAPGWIPRLAATYRAVANIGALGPKLLYEDDSLQHAGESFVPNPDGFGWDCLPLFKGLHRDFAPANMARSVPAVTAACLMIARDLFLQQGGFDEGYVQGDYEDSDLCLRLQTAGRRNWYEPAVELYHLEGVSYPSASRRQHAIYNRWRHTQRRERDLAALRRDHALAFPCVPPVNPAITRVG